MGFSQKEYWSGLPFPPPGESSQLRDQTHVFCIGRRILYHGSKPLTVTILIVPFLKILMRVVVLHHPQPSYLATSGHSLGCGTGGDGEAQVVGVVPGGW